jgi:predicted  nucleic acid-binding Zn-ribbon protein
VIDPEIENLLILQDRDIRRDNLKKEIAGLPATRERVHKQITQKESEAEAAKARLQALELRASELEGTVESEQAKIVRFKNQQLTVKKNEEYQALEHEITAADAEKEKAEDEQIGVMIEIDEAKEEFGRAKERIQDEISDLKDELNAIDQRETALKEDLARAEAAVAEAEAAVSRKFARAYWRVKEQLKTPPYVAPIENQISGRSHLRVSNELAAAAREHGEVHYCEDSGCIVYAE